MWEVSSWRTVQCVVVDSQRQGSLHITRLLEASVAIQGNNICILCRMPSLIFQLSEYCSTLLNIFELYFFLIRLSIAK